MKVLCTFSGHYGDILWSLPTVRELAKQHGGKVDFAVMPQFVSLVPLLESQSYINRAFAIDEWKLANECFGCQPWESPNFEGRCEYDKVIDLTYKMHPHSMRLAEWTAKQTAGVALPQTWIPFIDVERVSLKMDKVVAYNFNPMYGEEKSAFLEQVKLQLPRMTFVETGHMKWVAAATLIDDAICFIGCRSSNYALAHGVGAKVIILEPHPARTAPVFDFPFGPTPEVDVSRMRAPENQVSFAVSKIQQWAEEKENGEHLAAEAGDLYDRLAIVKIKIKFCEEKKEPKLRMQFENEELQILDYLNRKWSALDFEAAPLLLASKLGKQVENFQRLEVVHKQLWNLESERRQLMKETIVSRTSGLIVKNAIATTKLNDERQRIITAVNEGFGVHEVEKLYALEAKA